MIVCFQLEMSVAELIALGRSQRLDTGATSACTEASFQHVRTTISSQLLDVGGSAAPHSGSSSTNKFDFCGLF